MSARSTSTQCPSGRISTREEIIAKAVARMAREMHFSSRRGDGWSVVFREPFEWVIARSRVAH